MNVGVQRRPAALNRRHRPAAAPNPQHPRPALLETEQRAHEHPQHGAAETVVVGQPIAQPEWERQHPLAHRQAAEHAVDKVRGELAHAPAAARRTDAPLARKCDEHLSRTAVAPEARKAARHHAAGQELAQLALHEPRQALAAAAQARLGQKGFEMLAHHLVQDGAPRAGAGRRCATPRIRATAAAPGREALPSNPPPLHPSGPTIRPPATTRAGVAASRAGWAVAHLSYNYITWRRNSMLATTVSTTFIYCLACDQAGRCGRILTPLTLGGRAGNGRAQRRPPAWERPDVRSVWPNFSRSA